MNLTFSPLSSFPGPRPDSRAAALSRRALLLASLALAQLAHAQTAPASATPADDEVVDLGTFEVIASDEEGRRIDIASSNLGRVTGAVAAVDSALAERGRVGTSADLLAFQPGVFAAPPSGSGDGIKISVRGSAIARGAGNFFRSGILFTFDGLPVTGAGGTPYELFETYGLKYTEILLGGNAYERGALQLGGAINYVTKTGYDFKGVETRLDYGSFGTTKLQVASGQVVGNFDSYLSVASFRTDGYQSYAKGKALNFAGNIGYRFSPKVSTRFYLRYRTTENESPGSISRTELATDSSKPNPNNVTNNNYRTQPGSTWLANRTYFQIDSTSRLEVGLVYHDAPIDISPKPSAGNFDPPTPDPRFAIAERSIWTFRDITLTANYSRTDTLFGRKSYTTIGFSIDKQFDADVNTYANNYNVTTGARAFKNLLKTANYDNSEHSSFRIINTLSLTDKFSLYTGGALAYIRRAGEVTYFRLPPPSPGLPASLAAAPQAPGAVGRSIDREKYYFAPRLGLRYTANQNVTVFTNVTRSIEGPNSWQLNRGSAGNYQYHDNIKDQKAIAYELGTRIRAGAFSGTASVYRTDVKDELLVVPIDPSNLPLGSYTFSGSPTYKQGLELGLDAVLWSDNGFLAPAPDGRTSKLVLTQAFTWNKFAFKNDRAFGKNDLPGVPDQNYQARLQYDHASGFYGSFSVQYASRYFADFANYLEVPDYTIYGVGVGFEESKKRWAVSVDVRNLLDQSYASSAGPVFDGSRLVTRQDGSTFRTDNPGLRTYQVGDGFGIYSAVTFRF